MDYLPVRLNTIRPGSKLFFDLFIPVGERYVHYMRNSDEVDVERLKKLKDKKIRKLYIEIAHEGAYLDYLDSGLDDLCSSSVSIEKKAAITHDTLTTTAENAERSLETEAAFNRMEGQFGKVTEFLLSDKSAIKKILESAGKSLDNFQHAATVTSLSLAVGAACKLESGELLELGIAAILHDIGKTKFDFDPMTPQDRMTPEQLKKYKEHTRDGADMLAGKPFVSPRILGLVTDHEEVGNKRGFPEKKDYFALKKPYQILNLCNNLYIKSGTDDSFFFNRGATEIARFDNAGSFGIGTTTPNELLTVDGVTSLAYQATPTDDAGYGKVYVKADDKLYFKPNGGAEIDLTTGSGGGGGSSVYGAIVYEPISNYQWNGSSGSWTSYPADSDCNTGTLVNNASAAAAGKVPGIQFATLPAGDYMVVYTGYAAGNGTGSSCEFRIFDGTTASGYARVAPTSVEVASSTNTIIGFYSYGSSQSNIEFNLQYKYSSGGGCRVINTGDRKSEIQVISLTTGGGGSLTADSVTSAEIANDAVDTTEIIDDAVTVSKIDFASSDAGEEGINIPSAAADPTLGPGGTALVAGQMYFNTGDSKTYIYDGGSWNELGSGSGGGLSETPDFDSGWVSISKNSSGEITHGLGTEKFAKFRMILRESAANDDEVIIDGMDAGAETTSSPNYYGISFFVDQDDATTNKVKYFTAINGIYRAAVYSGASAKNWATKYDLGNTGEVKIQIWKFGSSSGGSGSSITCPTGFTKVQSHGYVHGCIQDDEDGSLLPFVANNTCFTDHGGRLPSFHEIKLAFNNYALNNETDDTEHVADTNGSINCAEIGPAGTITTDAGCDNAKAYRCWIPAGGGGGGVGAIDDSSDATAITIDSNENVGIGTATPATTLDIAGTMRMTKNAAAPYTCDASGDSAMAVTNKYTTCICKNGTGWVETTNGTTACSWDLIAFENFGGAKRYVDLDYPKNCNFYKTPQAGYSPATVDDLYWIDTDGVGGNAPYQAYCDMTTDGGGWTLVGRYYNNDATNMAVTAAVGTITNATQLVPAELSDTEWNNIRAATNTATSDSRMRIKPDADVPVFLDVSIGTAISNTTNAAVYQSSLSVSGPWNPANNGCGPNATNWTAWKTGDYFTCYHNVGTDGSGIYYDAVKIDANLWIR